MTTPLSLLQTLTFESTVEFIAQRQRDGIGDPSAGADRVFRVLNLAFPTVVFVGIGYVMLVDKIFGLPTALARMLLPSRLHVAVGLMFRCTVPLGWLLMHALLVATCLPATSTGPLDAVCHHDPLARRWCVVSSVVTVMLLAIGQWFERSLLHFAGLQTHTSIFKRSIAYAGISVAWLGLSERDSLAIVLLAMLSVRKLRWAPIGRLGHTVVGLYVRGLKLLIVAAGYTAMRRRCPAASQKHGVGATLVSLVS